MEQHQTPKKSIPEKSVSQFSPEQIKTRPLVLVYKQDVELIESNKKLSAIEQMYEIEEESALLIQRWY